jgi:hypothetical protein
MRWLLFIEQINQGIGESKLGVCILAFTGDPWITYQRIIGPDDQGKGI